MQSGVVLARSAQGIVHKHCRVLRRANGYGYTWLGHFKQPKDKAATASRPVPFLTALKDGVSRSKI